LVSKRISARRYVFPKDLDALDQKDLVSLFAEQHRGFYREIEQYNDYPGCVEHSAIEQSDDD